MSKFSQSEHINAKLRIQGVEVPFVGVRTDSGINIPSTATIQLIPYSWAKKIRPGTLVEVFYKDFYASQLSGMSVYRLLFEGEVRALSYHRSEGNRAITLSCVDFTNYLIQARQYYMNFQTGEYLGAAPRAVFAGASTITGELFGTDSKINSFFSKSGGEDDSFIQVVRRIIEDVQKSNSFFEFNFHRLSLYNRIITASTQKMTKAIFSHTLFQEYIKQQINKSGGVESLWKILSMLLAMVHHEIISLSSPSYVPEGLLGPEQSGPIYWTEQEIIEISTNTNRASKRYGHNFVPGNFIIKPTAWMVDPPSCNIVFPNEIMQMSFTENWNKMITRLQLIPHNPIFASPELAQLTALYQPYELQEHMRSVPFKKGKDGSKLRSFDFISDEELERGIIPGYATILPGSTSFLLSHAMSKIKGTKDSTALSIFNVSSASTGVSGRAKSTITSGDYNIFLQRLAEFEYHRKRAAAVSFSASLSFKPHMVPGYPSAIIDTGSTDMDIVAYVTRVGHTISANGRRETDADFALARSVNSKSISFSPNISQYTEDAEYALPTQPNEPPLPAWFDDIYTNGQIGMHVYSKVLGCASLLNSANNKRANISFVNPLSPIHASGSGRAMIDRPGYNNHLVEKRQRLLDALAKLKKEYAVAESSGIDGLYVYKKTFRPIVTEKQLLGIFYQGALIGGRSFFSDSVGTNDSSMSYVDAQVFTGAPTRVDADQQAFGAVADSVSGDSIKKVKSAKKKDKAPEKELFRSGDGIRDKNGNNFLYHAKRLFLGGTYKTGESNPSTSTADCSGVTYGTALHYFGVKLSRRRSIEMYANSVQAISVETALKTPGAIVFRFVNVSFVHPASKKADRVKHVGISVGDGVSFLESLGPKITIQIVTRAHAATYWTHAGLLPGFKYQNPEAIGPGFAGTNAKTDARQRFAKRFSDINYRLKKINENRWKIARNYQRELASSMGYKG